MNCPLLLENFSDMCGHMLQATLILVILKYHLVLVLLFHAGHDSPSFVGNNYYCESGNPETYGTETYTNDPLWDGEGCVGANNNCYTSHGMPWFIRQFPVSQQEDIEVRICTDQDYGNEAVLIDQLQLYVQ